MDGGRLSIEGEGGGRTFNMEIVEAAVRMILRGSKLISTNIDPNCPTAYGLRPW